MHVLNFMHFFHGAPNIARGLIEQMDPEDLDLQVEGDARACGYCALHFVAGPSSRDSESNAQIVSLLLSRRATLELRTEMGLTPLLMAVGQGQVNVARALVDARADINAVSWHVPDRGKPRRNISDFVGKHSSSMRTLVESTNPPRALGNSAKRDSRRGGGNSKEKRKQDRWARTGAESRVPTIGADPGAEPRGSAEPRGIASSSADPAPRSRQWSRMNERVQQDFGGDDPRMRHTGVAGAAVLAQARETHSIAAPSHGQAAPTLSILRQPVAEPRPEEPQPPWKRQRQPAEIRQRKRVRFEQA